MNCKNCIFLNKEVKHNAKGERTAVYSCDKRHFLVEEKYTNDGYFDSWYKNCEYFKEKKEENE